MQAFDLFNGDADGLCALHQLRMAQPRSARLITGVKRDIDLFRHLPHAPGLAVTALDICFDRNAERVRQVLEADGEVLYVDHHAASQLFEHPRLQAHIDPSPAVCTALLVDSHLGGRFRDWAITGAFGDNLVMPAQHMAQAQGHSDEASGRLRQLGLLLNYNAYGEEVQDLHCHPLALYEALRHFESPFDFIDRSLQYRALAEGYDEDQSCASGLRPHQTSEHGLLYLLPALPWARRLCGTLANALVTRHPGACVAVLTPRTDAGYLVSVRTHGGIAADALCRQYAGGNGRAIAAGIDRLPDAELDRFIAHYFLHIQRGP